MAKKETFKKETEVKRLIIEADKKGFLTRQSKLVYIVTESTRLMETASPTRSAVYESIIAESKDELMLFFRAEMESTDYTRVNDTRVNSYDEFLLQPGRVQMLILRKVTRYCLKMLHSRVDEDGNSAPLYYGDWVDTPFFACRMDEATSQLWVCLADAVERNDAREDEEKRPFSVLMVQAGYNALHTVYRAEVKHDRYTHGLTARQAEKAGYTDGQPHPDAVDFSAYEARQPEAWMQSRAIANMMLDSYCVDDIDRAILVLTGRGYTQQEIADGMETLTRDCIVTTADGKKHRLVIRGHLSQKQVSIRLDMIKARMQCDRMNDALDRQEARDAVQKQTRKNASPKKVVRIWVMQCIRYGMSYARIAQYLTIGNDTKTADDVRKVLFG